MPNVTWKLLILLALTIACGPHSLGTLAWAQQSTAGSRLEALLRDAETAAGLAASGGLFYKADENKKQWGQYCAQSLALANEGQFREAVREASKALFIGESTRNSEAISYASRDLAYAYVLAGEMEKAEEWAKHSLVYFKRISRVRDRSVILAPVHKILGDVALRRNEFDTAVAEYRSALSETTSSATGIASNVPIRLSIANAEIRRQRFETARQVLSEITNSDATWEPYGLRAHGQLALAERNYTKAVDHFSQAIARVKPGGNPYDLMWMHYGLSQALSGAGDREKAHVAIFAAIDLARQLRTSFRSTEFRAGFFGEVQSIYDDAIGLLIDAKRIDEALTLSEESRARTLLDILKGQGHVEEPNTPDAVSRIPKGVVIVVYHVLDNRTLAWTIRSGSTTGASISIGRKELSVLTERFRRSIFSRASDTKEQSRKLYELLVHPLRLAPDESLIVVPHKALHYLPMHALAGPQGYLIEERAVGTAPSLNAMLAMVNAGTSAKAGLLALGNPDLDEPKLALPGAEREVKLIGDLYKDSHVFVGREASKPRFVSQAPGKGMIHIAAHATVDEVDPLYSSIRLARGGQVRGDLEAREILNLNLSTARLVTLSGCESGLGKVKNGDEFFGFKRTFLAAGAHALLVSLWPVEDESTAILMSAFYKELLNRPMIEALRQAQLTVLKSAPHSDPLFWAPFVLVGDWR